jgi:hypothetical protein
MPRRSNVTTVFATIRFNFISASTLVAGFSPDKVNRVFIVAHGLAIGIDALQFDLDRGGRFITTRFTFHDFSFVLGKALLAPRNARAMHRNIVAFITAMVRI